jgi:type I restriction enzyme, S subunit
MVGEWREYRIGEIADIVGGSTPSTSDPSNFNGDIPWITPKDLSGPHERYVSRGERNLSRKGLESCSAQLLPAGTVLVTSRAPIGYAAIAKNPIATNQGFRNLIPKPGFDSEFLYYWVKAHVEELQRHASGSTFQELTGTALAQIRIRVPPLPEQRAIAHILGTLDDKIELNRRMSETLEAMARALFKAWFVDFEPVRAKMEGRWQRGQSLPGLPAHLYDLFPDRLVDSELGEIRRGGR